MKTWIYRERIALDDLHLVERPDPTPGPRDVVLRMRAAALNYRDLALAKGSYHIGATAPLVPVSDGAGEVVARGEEVTRFELGDLVIPLYCPDWIDGPVRPEVARRRLGGPNDGVLSEYFRVDEREAVRAPRNLEATEAAALLIPTLTAWNNLYQAGATRPGETVLVLGTGGVSLAALQLAKAGGAKVVMVTRSDKHSARLRELGADVIIARGEASDWSKDVLDATEGRGADVSIDVVGGASLARTIAATRVSGRVHLVGFVAGSTAPVDTFEAIRRAITVHVATTGNRESFIAAIRAIEHARIRPVIDRVFRMHELPAAFARLGEGGHLGKVVLTIP